MAIESKRSISFGLRERIIVLCGICTFFMLAAAAYGFWQFQVSLRSFDEGVMSSQKDAVDIAAVEINFKKQIQEWKDTLLRGQKPDALDKYWSNFQQREGEVRSASDRLSHGIGDPETARLVGQFFSAHKDMGAAYRRGLQEFKDHNFDSAAGDNAVAGIDRAPTELLTRAKERLVSLVEARAREARDGAHRTTLTTALLFGVVTVGSLVLFLVILQRSISRPLAEVVSALSDLARGNTAAQVSGTERRDEIGEVARALQVFKENMIETEGLRAQQEEFKTRSESEKKAATRNMANVVETETTTAVKAVGDTAQEVRQAAEEMSEFATAVSIDTRSVAAASEQALVSAQTVSSAAEELTASIQEINTQVARTAEVARLAVASGEIATTTVRSLTDAIGRISDVTRLIGDIASQTNLLALNATIEAARAGEAGRGFAVVAAEVKNLASQTARSTEDINRQVAEIQTVSASAVGAMSDVGLRIGEIDEATSTILSAIEQQAAATREITRNVTETASSAREVSSKIQNVSAGAAKVGSQAANVRQSISEITSNIAGLQAVLVRVVRTSTEDANRRQFSRYSVTANAEILDALNKRISGELADISEGGAMIGCSSGMRIGERGSLRLEGISSPLSFVVRGQQDDALNVEFELAGAQGAAFQQWFNQQVAAKLAKAS
jgi:methyl-accepting chemotaxis protein